MARMVVSVFDARGDAETARERLRERGFKNAEIRIAGGESASTPAAGRQAAEGLVRTFGGLMSDTDAERYGRAVTDGKSVLAIRVPDEAAAARATVILDALALEVDSTLSRTEAYALPNSPVDWWESFEGEKPVLREFPEDPGRPEQHILDAGALGTEELRELAEKAEQRGKDKP